MYADHAAIALKESSVEPGRVPVRNRHSCGGASVSMAAPCLINFRFPFRPNVVGFDGKDPNPTGFRSLCEFGTNDKGGREFNSEDELTVVHGGTIPPSEDISSSFGARGRGRDDHVTRTSLFGKLCATILYISNYWYEATLAGGVFFLPRK